MKSELKLALLKMGYRKLHGGYAKPIGFQLFTCKKYDDKYNLENWFKAIPDKPLLWNRYVITDDLDYGLQIKRFEQYEHCHAQEYQATIDFSFLTKEQESSLLLS